MIDNNYNINESNIEQLNEANIFKAVLGAIAGLIGWTSVKIFKKTMKTGKSIYLKRYLDSVEEQIKKGTKSKHPDGFDKIIAKADSELVSDFEKFTELFNNIKEDISNSEDINPVNLRLLNNSQEIFKKKYIDSIKNLMDSLIKQYDSGINNAIDKFNADYNKNEGIGKKLDGDKIKKIWESYKNKIEEIRDEYIQNFEETENFKNLYGLIFGEMNQLKKELDMQFNGHADPLLLRRIFVSADEYDSQDEKIGKKTITVDMKVEYDLTTFYNLNNHMKVDSAMFISTLDESSFDSLKEKLNNTNKSNIKDFVETVREFNNSVDTLAKIHSIERDNLKISDFSNISKNKYKFTLNYNFSNLVELIPILNRHVDQGPITGKYSGTGSFYALSILRIGDKLYKASQEYTKGNTGSLTISINGSK